MRVDLHTHTRYSRDSVLRPADLVARARKVGLDRIAVTDHNAIDGALEASALDPALVIVGEELDCADGTHLIGLFIHRAIPPGLSVRETAERIREQGGVVYAPHPYAYLSAPASHADESIAVADIVEVFNARAFLPRWNVRALAAAREKSLPMAAGSDGHFAREIGSAWTELPASSSAEEFRRALPSARAVGLMTQSPLILLASFAIEKSRSLRSARTVPVRGVPEKGV